MSRVTVEPGVVHTYNPDTGNGLVKSEVGLEVFKSVDFSSGRPPRFPIVGEEIEIVRCDGSITLIRVPADVS